jgi:hypothetical protein
MVGVNHRVDDFEFDQGTDRGMHFKVVVGSSINGLLLRVKRYAPSMPE